MCAAVIPFITAAAAIGSTISAMNKPKVETPVVQPVPTIPDPPAAPTLEPTPPTPTEQTATAASPRDQSALTESKDKLRKKASGMTSWLSTNKTGGLGLSGAAPTQKKTLLGGTTSTLG